jgi:methylenetetrahydrofolate dehydrogenase (NAD+)
VGGAADVEDPETATEKAATDDTLRNLVPVRKDVEALSDWYQEALYHNIRTLETLPSALNAPYQPPPGASKALVPCAPLAVVKILEHLGVYKPALPAGTGLTGQCVAVFNRSKVVGRPLAAMLANDGAAVFSIDLDAVYAHDRGADYPVPLSPEQAVRQVGP